MLIVYGIMITWEVSLERQKCFSDEDKRLFRRFAKDSIAHQIGERRITKYRTDLTICNTMTGMGLAEMTKGEAGLTKAISKINEDKSGYTFTTKKDAKRTLGSLYCFITYKDRSLSAAPKPMRKLIQHVARGSDKLVARPIIKREEMREMLKYGDTLDKSIISLLFDSGMRNGEFVQLKKSDLAITTEEQELEEKDKEGKPKKKKVEILDVKVPAGKTGERRITCLEPVVYVKAWLLASPSKDKDGMLWVSPKNGKPLDQQAVAKRIRKTVERMNLARKKKGLPPFIKDVNPHNWRHSRASELGGENGMTEQILCKVFGWEIGSDMPKTYLHLTDEQVKKAVMRTYGYEKKEAKVIYVERECPICHKISPMGEAICTGCGYDLQENTYINKAPSRLVDMQQKLEAMEKKQEAQKKETENLARQLAAITVGSTKRNPKAPVDDKG